MVKKKLKGKSRRDKYYHLAKETGYRARSAFKLLQLNKKFNFLQSSQVLVDLCAAPGGWLQVASEHMPMSSIIIGVDLVPIRPIPRCITFQDDITKESCRSQLKQELHQWKVDCFLNDGAPNVGKNWLHDAYSQSVLALHALKLATEFLRKGGWFITKVFRSKDYQALMWVFGQLFNKVHGTKPQASRNESAEIFVVCQGYKCPDKIDKKFFDVKSVFEEVEREKKQVKLQDFERIKKKKAKGYEDTNGLLFTKKTVGEFLESKTPLRMLSEVNQLFFEDSSETNHPLVSPDIIENVKDIKSLGKKEIRSLLKWHKKFNKSDEVSSEKLKDSDQEIEEDSEEEIDRKLEEIKEMESKILKKKKKTILKERHKLRERMSHAAQSSHEQDDMELFALSNIKSAKQLSKVADVNDVPSDDEAEFFQDSDVEVMSDDDGGATNSDDNLDEKQESEESDYENIQEDNKTNNPLIKSLDEEKDCQLWFDKDIFKEIESKTDEAEEIRQATKFYEHQNKLKLAPKEKGDNNNDLQAKIDQYDSGSDSEVDSEDDIVDCKKSANSEMASETKLDAESLALGTVLSTSNKQKRDIIDSSFNRYTFNDEEGALPDWFIEDEKKRIRKDSFLDNHVPKNLVGFYKSKDMQINARTIKKVAEAKARKKKKQLKKLERARKQAEGISDSKEMSNKEKAAHIKGIYKKAGLLKKQKEHTTYVFAKRGTGKKVRRPPGVGGKFKVVDKRMKKDLRSETGRKGKQSRGKSSKRKGKK